MDSRPPDPVAKQPTVVRSISQSPAYVAPELVPLRRAAELPPAPPAVSRGVVEAIDAICRAADLEDLNRAVAQTLSPVAGATVALVRATTLPPVASELPGRLALFAPRLPDLARRALQTGSFAWEREGDSFAAVFPLGVHGEQVGMLLLAGSSNRLLHLIGASGLLLVLSGPLGLAVAALQLRQEPARAASSEWMARLDHEVKRAQRYGQIFALVRLGLPTAAHDDQLEALMTRSLRITDTFVRIAEGQFGLLLPGTPAPGAVEVVGKLARAWQGLASVHRAPRAGVAEVSPGDRGGSELLARAEHALATTTLEWPMRVAPTPRRVTQLFHLVPDGRAAVL